MTPSTCHLSPDEHRRTGPRAPPLPLLGATDPESRAELRMTPKNAKSHGKGEFWLVGTEGDKRSLLSGRALRIGVIDAVPRQPTEGLLPCSAQIHGWALLRDALRLSGTGRIDLDGRVCLVLPLPLLPRTSNAPRLSYHGHGVCKSWSWAQCRDVRRMRSVCSV